MPRLISVLRTVLSRRDFMVLILCDLIVGLAFSFVLPFTSLFGTQEVGMSPSVFGLFMAVTSLAGIFVSTRLAHWSDTRFARKTIFLIGGLSGSIGYLGFAWVRNGWLLTVIGSVFLGASSVVFSQLFAYARTLLNRSEVDPAQIPLYMNVFRLCVALSWTVGPALASWVMQQYGFRGTYQIAAGLFLVFVLVVAAAVPFLPPSEASRAEARKVPLGAAFRLPGLTKSFVAFSVFFACSTMGTLNLTLLMLNTLHGRTAQVGIAYSVAPAFEIPLMFYLGAAATRIPANRMIRGAFLVAMVHYAGLACIGKPWQVYPLQFLSAAIVAVTSGVAITYFQNYMPGQPGTATNLYTNALRVGSTLGFIVFGTISGTLGDRAVYVVCAALSAGAALLMPAPRT
jgi:SET family sugar efflux transporter-like MFS transporter